MSSSSDSELPPKPDQPEGTVPPKAPPETPSASAEAPPPAADDLPEWEPLTPELVEDEAIRGDFVMRWAVVGLAILLGCSQIADTKTLVHVKSGEYLASHGILPPANDVFSYTRSDQPWVNPSWLFDLATAGVNSIGDGIALSIFQAILAAATFALIVHIVRPGIRTWWGSICAALALLACFRQFTVQPELITLLGVAADAVDLDGSARRDQPCESLAVGSHDLVVDATRSASVSRLGTRVDVRPRRSDWPFLRPIRVSRLSAAKTILACRRRLRVRRGVESIHVSRLVGAAAVVWSRLPCLARGVPRIPLWIAVGIVVLPVV